MASCTENSYTIRFTDKNKSPIRISKRELNTDSTGIALVGKDRLEYGEVFNENFLHILENFACNANPLNNNEPDLSTTNGASLSNPVEGQLWANKTNNTLYVCTFSDATTFSWVPLLKGSDVAGNSGVILHDEFLPKPVSAISGKIFEYNECVWNVSPFNILGEVDYLKCYAGSDAKVVMQYRVAGDPVLKDGYANYQIIGITGNINIGDVTIPTIPDPTTYPTYVLSGPTLVNEGTTATITLTTSNVADGPVPFVISGVQSGDITMPGGFVFPNGIFTLSSGTASLDFGIVSDMAVEGNEILTLTLLNNKASKSIIIADSGTPITQCTVAVSSATTAIGSSVTITGTTAIFPTGAYSLVAVSATTSTVLGTYSAGQPFSVSHIPQRDTMYVVKTPIGIDCASASVTVTVPSICREHMYVKYNSSVAIGNFYSDESPSVSVIKSTFEHSNFIEMYTRADNGEGAYKPWLLYPHRVLTIENNATGVIVYTENRPATYGTAYPFGNQWQYRATIDPTRLALNTLTTYRIYYNGCRDQSLFLHVQ